MSSTRRIAKVARGLNRGVKAHLLGGRQDRRVKAIWTKGTIKRRNILHEMWRPKQCHHLSRCGAFGSMTLKAGETGFYAAAAAGKIQDRGEPAQLGAFEAQRSSVDGGELSRD